MLEFISEQSEALWLCVSGAGWSRNCILDNFDLRDPQSHTAYSSFLCLEITGCSWRQGETYAPSKRIIPATGLWAEHSKETFEIARFATCPCDSSWLLCLRAKLILGAGTRGKGDEAKENQRKFRFSNGMMFILWMSWTPCPRVMQLRSQCHTELSPNELHGQKWDERAKQPRSYKHSQGDLLRSREQCPRGWKF